MDLIKREDAIKALREADTFMYEWDACESVIKDIPSAEPKQGKWIPCSERLPTLNEDGVSDMVLLCWSDGQRTVGAYQGDRTFVGQAWPVARDCRVTVIAWMPLPEPWEGADDED